MEAPTNVDLHTHAHRVELTIRKEAKLIHLEISDDGKSLDISSVLMARGKKHLERLGMRKRIEMAGGITHRTPHGNKAEMI